MSLIPGSITLEFMNSRKFPAILKSIGLPVVIATWILAARLVWEQTFWSWERGPQMVGFSLMHSGLGVLLILGVFVGLLWPVAVCIAAVLTRSSGGRGIVAQVTAYAMAWVLIMTPYGYWQRLFIWKFSPPNAVRFFTFAAATGDLPTVKAFLAHGVNVNAQAREGTALHGAVVQGNLEMIEYLLNQGADINAANPYGDTPLATAADARSNRAQVQTLLESKGGILIRGTEEQRQRVVKERVRRDIEKMNLEPR
jgi:hypothetical protein